MLRSLWHHKLHKVKQDRCLVTATSIMMILEASQVCTSTKLSALENLKTNQSLILSFLSLNLKRPPTSRILIPNFRTRITVNLSNLFWVSFEKTPKTSIAQNSVRKRQGKWRKNLFLQKISREELVASFFPHQIVQMQNQLNLVFLRVQRTRKMISKKYQKTLTISSRNTPQKTIPMKVMNSNPMRKAKIWSETKQTILIVTMTTSSKAAKKWKLTVGRLIQVLTREAI